MENYLTEPKQQSTASTDKEPLLELKNLKVHFHLRQGTARAVDGVSYAIKKGETLGLVGESGCGKSVSALSILGLVPSPPSKIEDGQIFFEGQDLLRLDENSMRKIRGQRISMIFQEPMTALNPVYTIGDQVAESFRLHRGASKKEARLEAIGMLEKVQIADAAARARDYPHQLSGGMRQRAMIAMALACQPQLLIADEPTTALDVTVQAQVLNLMRELQETNETAILMITHDLGVIAEMADRVAVMYAGQIVESGQAEQLLEKPAHPYTIGLLNSIPDLETLDSEKKKKLQPIEGNVPSPMHWPTGCRFAERCPYAQENCQNQTVALEPQSPTRKSRCLYNTETFSPISS